MSSELPEIDNPNAYVVDDGESVGPVVLREIVQSIADGERPETAFVWWAGADEWVRFNSDPRLLEMLDVIDEQAAPSEPDEDLEIDLREHGFEDQQDGPGLPEISVVKETGLAALTTLGERLEALASATREFAASSKLDRVGTTPIGKMVLLGDDPTVPFSEAPSQVLESSVPTTLDSLVRESMNYERLSEQSQRVIELLAGACAAAFARHGFTVEHSSETPGYHHLLFLDVDQARQAQLLLTSAESVGGSESQYVALQVKWGQPPSDLGEAAEVVESQLPSALHGTGTISPELDLERGHALTSIDLVVRAEDYVGADFEVDHDVLHTSLDAIELGLEERWNELFTAAE